MSELLKLNIRVILGVEGNEHPETSDSEESDHDYDKAEQNEDQPQTNEESMLGPKDITIIDTNGNGEQKNNRIDNRPKNRLDRSTSQTTNNKSHNRRKHRGKKKMQVLDFEGPKLINGLKNWLIFHKLMGVLNLHNKPLYVSLIVRFFIVAYASDVMIRKVVVGLYHLKIIGESYRNPIFIFITFMALIAIHLQSIVVVHQSSLKLCPLFKILTTPKLCFISEEVQHIIGTKSLGAFLVFILWNGVLINMLIAPNWEEYVANFNFFSFTFDIYAYSVFVFMLLGVTLADLYIRLCFGHWLLALKTHMEHQFTYLHKVERSRSRRERWFVGLGASKFSANSSMRSRTMEYTKANKHIDATPSSTGMQNDFLDRQVAPLKLISFDQVQLCLNNMDDHLEVLRSIQVTQYVFDLLLAFLGNGSLYLVAYHSMVDRGNSFHGTLFLLISINLKLFLFLCYYGDRFIEYALKAFVQTIEDEYFMQSDLRQAHAQKNKDEAEGGNIHDDTLFGIQSKEAKDSKQKVNSDGNCSDISTSQDCKRVLVDEITPDVERITNPSPKKFSWLDQKSQKMLLIKKRDVLFCREFLHQFENHLATPWAKMTFKWHLHLIRTFVTLVAAQIIFDYEH